MNYISMVLTKQELENKFNILKEKRKTILDKIRLAIEENERDRPGFVTEEQDKKMEHYLYLSKYEQDINKMDTKVGNYEAMRIWQHVKYIFEQYIIDLYKYCSSNDKPWFENVRAFIQFHDDIELVNNSEPNEETVTQIKHDVFERFVGDDCANIDEDEFDGPDDLSPDEWETIDDILIHYYTLF